MRSAPCFKDAPDTDTTCNFQSMPCCDRSTPPSAPYPLPLTNKLGGRGLRSNAVCPSSKGVLCVDRDLAIGSGMGACIGLSKAVERVAVSLIISLELGIWLAYRPPLRQPQY